MNVLDKTIPKGSLIVILFAELIRAKTNDAPIAYNEPYTVKLGDVDVDVVFDKLSGDLTITYLTYKE